MPSGADGVMDRASVHRRRNKCCGPLPSTEMVAAGDLHRRRRSGRQVENTTAEAPRRSQRRDLTVIKHVELIVDRTRLVDRKLHY